MDKPEATLRIGLEYYFQIQSSEKDSAISIGSGSVEVFATPSLIANMEKAALLCVENLLADSQTTVGTHLEISHFKATPIGQKISFKATLKLIEGKKLEFEVTATDEQDEIGNGKHTRYIINKEKFMNRLKGI